MMASFMNAITHIGNLDIYVTQTKLYLSARKVPFTNHGFSTIKFEHRCNATASSTMQPRRRI